MEFWGVEVKSGEPLKVNPGDDKIVHLSMACLGEVNKDKGSGPVSLYVKFGDQKLAIGTLSSDNFPQISYDLVFEKEFELSHTLKNGSVFFTGFKAESQLASDNDEDSDDVDGEDIPVNIANGIEIDVKNSAKPDANESKQKEKVAGPRKNDKAKETANGEDEEDSSESESDEDSSEEELMANGEIESSEDDDDTDDDEESDDDETPKKAETTTKRALDSSKKTPVPVKKAKFVTPQKTDGKSSGYVGTPHPSKQTDKAAASSKQPVKQQTPKSAGDYSCKPCNRSFKTEEAINSHNKAKHGAK